MLTSERVVVISEYICLCTYFRGPIKAPTIAPAHGSLVPHADDLGSASQGLDALIQLTRRCSKSSPAQLREEATRTMRTISDEGSDDGCAQTVLPKTTTPTKEVGVSSDTGSNGSAGAVVPTSRLRSGSASQTTAEGAQDFARLRNSLAQRIGAHVSTRPAVPLKLDLVKSRSSSATRCWNWEPIQETGDDVPALWRDVERFRYQTFGEAESAELIQLLRRGAFIGSKCNPVHAISTAR